MLPHGAGHLVEVALSDLLAQPLHQLVELLARLGRDEVVVLQAAHLPGQVGRQHVELHVALRRAALGRCRRGARRRCRQRPARTPPAPRARWSVISSSSRAMSSYTPPRSYCSSISERLSRRRSIILPQAFEPVAVGVGEALLHEPPQRRVQVAVVQQVVGQLSEQAVRIEVEAGLGCRPTPSSGTGRPLSARTPPADLHCLPPSGASAATRLGNAMDLCMRFTLSRQRPSGRT